MFIDFRERKRKRGKRKVYWLPPICVPTRHRTHNIDMCPDQEQNPQPLVYGTPLQPTEPRQSGRP